MLTPVWGLKNFNFSKCLWALQYLRGKTGKNPNPCSGVTISSMVRLQRQLQYPIFFTGMPQNPLVCHLPRPANSSDNLLRLLYTRQKPGFALQNELSGNIELHSLHAPVPSECLWHHQGRIHMGSKNHTAKQHKISHPSCKTLFAETSHLQQHPIPSLVT